MHPGPGSLVPSTVENRLPVRKPWAMRFLKMVEAAKSSLRWTGLMSPDSSAKARTSSLVIFLAIARLHADREILEIVTMAEAGAAVSIARHVLFPAP